MSRWLSTYISNGATPTGFQIRVNIIILCMALCARLKRLEHFVYHRSMISVILPENIVKLFKHFMIVYHVSLVVSQSVENHQLFSLRFGWLLHFIPSMLAQIHLAINITDYEAQSAKPRSKTSYHQVLQSRGMVLCLVMFYIIML